MSVQDPAPCSAWATLAQLQACHDVAGVAVGTTTQALNAASDVLWRLSGYKFPGVCTDTVRPCAQNAWLEGPGYNTMYQYGFGYSGWWSWLPVWGYCSCQSNPHRACGCQLIPEIRLGRAPILAVSQVKIDGAILAASAYHIDDSEWLVRIDGDTWPCCQNLTKADTAADTFSVAFTWGRNPPASGISAAVDLAWEYVKTCVDGNCAPPERIYNMQRQGTTVQMIAPERFGFDGFGNLRTGIKSVDRFLLAVGTFRPVLIASPDIDSDVRRVNT